MEIILASSSPRRKELMMKMGYDFKVISKDIDENFDAKMSVYENVKAVAVKKACAIENENPDALIIGCDTIVVLDGIVFGKPKSKDDAFDMLRKLSGKTHEVMSGVAIIYKNDVINFAVVSEVTFKNLSNDDIINYIKTGECFDKAGSYAIQGIGGTLIENYSGELDNIIGLPTEEIKDVLDGILK